jgi:NADPH:quinone reductase-like Zn-dependent oxidoreductase
MNTDRMMNVVLAHGREHTDLANEKLPVPRPGTGEVLVAVHATAATAGELNWSDDLPFIPCHDVSGTIVELGGGVTDLTVHDEVIGLIDFDRPGAAAQFTVVLARHLAPKPTCIDHVTAAALPLGSLTAWQALYQHYQVKKSDHVLVLGGAGASAVTPFSWPLWVELG